MKTMRSLLLGVPALAVAVSIGTIKQGADANATGPAVAPLGQVDTNKGFTPPLGSDKGSVTQPHAAPPRAPSLLGEEPIYYPHA